MMQEAEEEALLSTRPLLAFWSSSSPVTVLRRPRPRQHFSSGGERATPATGKRASRPAQRAVP